MKTSSLMAASAAIGWFSHIFMPYGSVVNFFSGMPDKLAYARAPELVSSASASIPFFQERNKENRPVATVAPAPTDTLDEKIDKISVAIVDMKKRHRLSYNPDSGLCSGRSESAYIKACPALLLMVNEYSRLDLLKQYGGSHDAS